MPIPKTGDKTLTEIIEEQKKFENREFLGFIFWGADEDRAIKLDKDEEGNKVFDNIRPVLKKFEGNKQVIKEFQTAITDPGDGTQVLTDADMAVLERMGLDNDNRKIRWALFKYDLEMIGTDGNDIPLEQWNTKLFACEGKQLGNMASRPRQLKFLDDFKNSLPEEIDVVVEVTLGEGFMGAAFKYRPLSFISKNSDFKKEIKESTAEKAMSAVNDVNDSESQSEAEYVNAEKVSKDLYISKFIQALKANTKVVNADNFDVKEMKEGTRAGIITVENSKAQDVFAKLKSEYVTYIANFGNALRPGGGVMQGANAQEESLFQSFPELFPSLVAAKEYYDENNEELDKMASDDRNMRRAAKILVKRDLIKKIAGGEYGEKLQAEAEKVMSAKSDERDNKINKFLAGLRANETRENLATLDKIAENANGEYSDKFQNEAKRILSLQSDGKDDKTKRMRKEMRELYSQMHLEIENSINISKDIDKLIEKKRTKEESKVKELSLELVKRNGFKRVVSIAPTPKFDASGNEVETGPGMIVINAPDLRTVIPSFDKKIADRIITYERDEGKVLNDMPEEERNEKFNEIAEKVLDSFKNEINGIVKESLTKQIGQGLATVVNDMKEDKKYAVVLGAVGCGGAMCC